ncbi:hypothetical protein HHK36_008411 [Tetracentron sinense]|uniref:Cytochrome P450 n=1 Tax=Tetracentron sinense TaxID=13715 RepID=A0A834ZFH2_TETSI|nr:hypothetical protein HHK36_008411 [Tetracentron sinense]
MEASSWILVAIVVGVGGVMLMVENFSKRSMKSEASKWPPGPPKFPIIGNLHQIKKRGELIHSTLARLAKVHGGIMTVWFGSWKPTIVVSDPELAWEVLVTKASDFSSRTLPYWSKITTADWHTISTSNFGPHWHTLRKGLHNTTFNPQTIAAQARLQEHDLVNMTASLREEASSNHGVVKPLLHLRRATVRVIARFCFGFDFDDEIFVEGIDSVVEETIRLTSHSRLADIFEISRHIPILRRSFLEAYRVKQKIEELIGPYISSRRSSSPNNCYLHFLLSQDFQEEVIISNLFDLFLLGVDSTSTTITWALAFLIHNQEIQHKLYEEFVRCGSGTISIEEVSKLRYLNAVVMETMRMKPIAPLGVPHKAARDSNIMGTKVVEGSTVVVNLYALLHDPIVWVEPHRFMPERFLTSLKNGNDGSLVGAMERSFLPFGAGRRVCAGMELAKPQVALTIAHLVNDFHWSSAVDGQLPDLSDDLTFVLTMKTPLVARIMPRRV